MVSSSLAEDLLHRLSLPNKAFADVEPPPVFPSVPPFSLTQLSAKENFANYFKRAKRAKRVWMLWMLHF
jgi:hypothetical protein